MKELYNALPLPDDRPITALCVVEDVSKCPNGYTIVSRTHDQDLDADLWKDGFFGKRVTRYLCLSKTEGPSGFVVDSLCLINDKDPIPNGFVLMSKTYGTEQKAWRKRQLCYRLSERSSVYLAVTDIIILSRAKKAPEGFTLAGEVNGLLLCYKSAPLPANPAPLQTTAFTSHLPNSVIQMRQLPDLPTLSIPLSPTPITSAKSPARPAPLPPGPKGRTTTPEDNDANRTVIISSATLSGFTGLEGVPFMLGPRIQCSGNLSKMETGRLRQKTAQELNTEYHYSFATEREATLRL